MRRCLVDLMVAVTGLLCLLYIFNIGVGIIELLPDNAPIVGNLDEAAVTALLIACLGYFGLDASKLINALRVLAGRPPVPVITHDEKTKRGAGPGDDGLPGA